MGYEYNFIFRLPLPAPELDQLIHYLKTTSSWYLLPTRSGAAPYVARYAYRASGPLAWDEDFLVEVSSQHIYLLLHTATADQTAQVLMWLEQGAATRELVGTLMEQ